LKGVQMTVRVGVIGFRHNHIYDLYRQADLVPEVEIVAACEEFPAARQQVEQREFVQLSHSSYQDLLASADCDVIAVGDYYGRRGRLLIDALLAGKHVIADKPLCTRLGELDEIERLSKEKGLSVGCMLNMRDDAQFIGVRNLVRQGLIGQVHAISFGGQHPLLLDAGPSSRAAWYFEPGKHGGTINDIGIHALDAIPWITGQRFAQVNAARSWNAFAGGPNASAGYPHFKDAAQMMLTMEDGCGVLGDVSYFSPNSSGYSLPFYWRLTLWGRKGVIETSETATDITIALDGEPGTRSLPLPPGNPGGYLEAFLHDIQGASDPDELSTADVLRASRVALTVQWAADTQTPQVHL
jgi:predicted dehydrogenase